MISWVLAFFVLVGAPMGLVWWVRRWLRLPPPVQYPPFNPSAERLTIDEARGGNMPTFVNSRYGNPWGAGGNGHASLFRAVIESVRHAAKVPAEAEVRAVFPWQPYVQTPADRAKLRVTWLGHACFLIEIGGVRILTDPVWGSPAPLGIVTGYKRITPPPCALTDLPDIDYVFISHSHRDHADAETLRALARRPKTPVFITGRGAEWLDDMQLGCSTIALTWWQETAQEGGIELCGLPCQHWSGRGAFDKNKDLWLGLRIFHRPTGASVLFFGDTAWTPAFDTIGRVFPEADVALIPCGSYEPRSTHRLVHADPWAAVRIFRGLRSKRAMAHHAGTFAGVFSNHPVCAPPAELATVMKLEFLAPESFCFPSMGATIDV